MAYDFLAIDLLPYILIFFLFLLCIPYADRNRTNSWLIYLVLLLFTILRYDVGWDYTMYVRDIENHALDRYEPLSKMIFELASYLNFYPIAFIIFGFGILYLTKKNIDRFSTNTLISWVVFYAYPQFFFASLSTIRQSLAAAIIFYSYRYCKERKLYHFLACIAVATLCHSSGLAGLLLYLLVFFPITKKLNVIFFIISFFISRTIQDVVFPLIASQDFNEQIKFYLKMNTKAPTMLPFLIYLITVVNLIFYKKLISINSDNKIYIAITTAGACLYNILIFEPNTALRISSIFLIFWTFIFPSYITIFHHKFKGINTALIVLFWFSISFVFLGIYIANYQERIIEKISLIPYKFWFNNL